MSVRFSANGNFLCASGGDKVVSIFETASGTVVHTLKQHQRHVGSCCFSRSGDLLATGSNDKSVALWNLNSLDSHLDMNRFFASREASSRKAIVADKSNAVLTATIVSHLSDVNALVFTSPTMMVSCSGDKTVRVWSQTPHGEWIEDGDVAARPLAVFRYGVTCADYCEVNGLLVVGVLDGHVIIFDTKDKFSQVTSLTCPGESSVRVCQLSPDGLSLVVGGDGDEAYIWAVSTWTLQRSLTGHDATIFLATFSPDCGCIVTGCHSGVLMLWSLDNSKPNFIVPDAHDMGITCGRFSPSRDLNDGSSVLVSGGNDSLLKVWKIPGDSKSIAFLRCLEGHGSSIMSIRFSTEGTFFASTSGDKTLRLWNSQTWKCVRLFEGHSRFVSACTFSPNGRLLASGSNDKLINVWSLSGNFVHSSLTENNETDDSEIPDEFICPITHDVMKFPVRCSDGFVYERAAITEWLTSGRQTSPMTNLTLQSTKIVPDKELRNRIYDFFEKL